MPFRKTGKILVAFDETDLATLRRLKAQGRPAAPGAGTPWTGRELRPSSPQVGGIGGFFSPETGICDPFLYTVALAENAVANGVAFFLNHPVTAVAPASGGYQVTAGDAVFSAQVVVNAAGLYSAQVAAMAGVQGYHIYPCRGSISSWTRSPRGSCPCQSTPPPRAGEGGLGIHLTPTVHGNILLGPSAEYTDSLEDTASTQPVLDRLFQEAQQPPPSLNRRQIIGAYAGLRPKQAPPGEGGLPGLRGPRGQAGVC